MNYKERISKKRSRIENKIIETYKIFPYSIDVSTRDQSGTGIKEFKTLFNTNDLDCRIALWNAIPRYTNIDEVEKDKFTDDEYQFILQKVGSRENYTYEFTNCNNAIYTDRLVLKSAKDPKMLKTYQKHLKFDGDFLLYTGFKLTREHLSWFHLSRPYCFAVCEKWSERMVGMVGLHHYDEERHMAQMEWYIFKPYRSMGYGKEAVTALAKRAFGKKLFEWREKVMEDTYKNIMPLLICFE